MKNISFFVILFSIAMPLHAAQQTNFEIENTTNLDQKLFEAAADGHYNELVVIALLNLKANINVRKNGVTPLILALYNGYPATAQILINHGADVNAAVSKSVKYSFWGEISKGFLLKPGDTPLYIAFKKGYAEIIKALINRGAIVKNDFSGSAALCDAIYYKQPDTIRLLLSRDAKVDDQTLRCAKRFNTSREMMELLENAKKSQDFKRKRAETETLLQKYETLAEEKKVSAGLRKRELKTSAIISPACMVPGKLKVE